MGKPILPIPPRPQSLAEAVAQHRHTKTVPGYNDLPFATVTPHKEPPPLSDHGIFNSHLGVLTPEQQQMTATMRSAADHERKHVEQQLDEEGFKILRARLLADPEFMDGVVKHLHERARKRELARLERDEANHKEALEAAYGTGGQG